METGQEVVYRTQDDSHVVMSEKVQSLAGSIYQEFEKMISKYDQEVVKDLMPLIVNVLECLDMSYTENQEHEVELELLREDNEQLVTQYEREKQLRKSSEQKLLEVEDAVEDERKDLVCKIESLESIVRMLELKSKNSSDHVFRLEEKESEMKKEYSKLHERYTELFKTHVDYMERSKILMSNSERLEPQSRTTRLPSSGVGQLSRSSGPISFGFQSLENTAKDISMVEDELTTGSPLDSTNSNTSLRNELNETQDNMEAGDGAGDANKTDRNNLWLGLSNSKHNSPDRDEYDDITADVTTPLGRSTTKREQRSGNTLYQELSFQDAEISGEIDEVGEVTGGWVHPGEYASSANDNFFGMGKEVENLIMENNELLATKNALNIVKDDLIAKVDELTSEQEILREEMKSLHSLKTRLRQRVADLEDELKKVKEEAAKQAKGNKSDEEEEEVPMAQRKRFTRVEMARVLMERNQYKERFMELQEAVRWTEMIRASKTGISSIDKQKGQTMWTFFSKLFRMNGDKEMPTNRKVNQVNLLYAPSTLQVTPTLATVRESSGHGGVGDKKKGIDYLDTGNSSSEKLAIRRANERKEQYRQVRAHVRKEDGRLQAYGWSLPAKVPPTVPAVAETNTRSQVPVPVPVYCRPLAPNESEFKIWCAAGVNLSGGRTKDGGSIVGSSIFYSTPPTVEEKIAQDDSEPHISKLEEELKEGQKVLEDGVRLEQKLSSLVWICSSTHNESKVTVIDANNPGEVLDSFIVCASHLLCIASVPGATESDYTDSNENNNNNNPLHDPGTAIAAGNTGQTTEDGEGDEDSNLGRITFVNNDTQQTTTDEDDSTGEKMSTVLPTMWLGAQNGYLYIHSAVADWTKSIVKVKVADSVLCIVHSSGRVLVALANGTVAIMRRGPDAQWDLSRYYVVDLGSPLHSVRSMTGVLGTVWCGYRNKLHVLDPVAMTIKISLEAHPRRESQVRQLAWLGDGVWVSIRLDSTLRLYHAHTYQHLQDVDIEPYVGKMLGTGKLGFSFVRITALLVSTGRLWIGTSNGVVISVPLSESSNAPGQIISSMCLSRGPGGVIRVYTDTTTDKVTPGSFIPYCSMAQAQLSFHGHRDAVKFFIAVPGAKTSVVTEDHLVDECMLVMSGGEGYIDFRVGDGSDDDSVIKDGDGDGNTNSDNTRGEKKLDLSHLIVWQVSLHT